MTPFEYVSVLISIILGLGITQIMTGIADLVHQWGRVRLYWPHLLWVVLVFVLHIQEWWITYELRVFTSWRLPFFLLFVLYPVDLFILARILFPMTTSEGEIDLRKFYFENFRRIFIWTMVLPVLSIISNIIVEGLHADQLVQVSLFLLLGWVAWKNYAMEALHKAIAIILLLALTISIIVNFDTWLIG